MNVVVNNLLTKYEVQGNGRCVLLLHGWGDSLQGLSRLQKSLADTYQVVSLDLPGFGSTQPPTTVWNLDDYVHHVHDFLVKTDLKPFAIVGHSNGGAMSIRGVATGEMTPEKIVLLAAAGIRTNHSTKKLLLKIAAKSGKVATVWLPKTIRRKLRRALYGAVGSDQLVVEQLQETFRATVSQDVQADAAKLNLPALLIYGENDQAVPLADGRRYHDLIAGSKLEVISDAGHFLHLEKPDLVTGLIKGFLQ